MQMKLVAALAATMLGVSGAANAADMYSGGGSLKDPPIYVPVNSWAGFYFGANGGYGWDAKGDKTVTATGTIPFGGGGTIGDSAKGTDVDGGFGGAQVGYNWQRDHIVFGFETDIQISDISDSVNSVTPGFGLNAKTTSTLDYFGTVRGRLGYAWDKTLLYFTGGFAYGKVQDSVNATFPAGGGLNFQLAHLGHQDIDTGYVVGGGIEFAAGDTFGLLAGKNWTVKVEYQYINLGSDKLTGSVLGILPLTSNNIDHEYHTVRVGLNYHIPNAYEPLK